MKKLLLIIGFLAYPLTACTEHEEPEQIVQEPESAMTAAQTRAEAATFTTLPDPYSLANMQAVYNNYGSDITLQATHKYVRFKPQSQEQLNRLEEVYELDLSDYPLDMEIPEGVEYIDPTIPEGDPVWYYSTVPANFVFPEDITKEIIRDCYIPADDEVINVPTGTRAGASGTYCVEELAFFNLGYIDVAQTRSGGGGGLRPGGHVHVTDDNDSHVPLEGIRVKIQSFTKSDWTTTDSDGKFTATKKFWKENLKCIVVFINKRHDFIFWDVASGWIPYFCRVKHKVNISKFDTDKRIIFSTGRAREKGAMYRATCEYYEMCASEGITKPPGDLKILVTPDEYSVSSGSCALMAKRINLGSGTGSLQWLLIDIIKEIGRQNIFVSWLAAIYINASGPDLIITPQGSTYQQIYNTMNHELSHASHYAKVGNSYWEGYIRYIGNSLLASDGESSYGDGTGQYAGNCEVGEMWANAIGDIQMCEEFQLPTNIPYPYANEGDGDWIEAAPLWALITRGVLTKKQVFDCLTSDVDTRDKLINKLRAGKTTAVANAITTAFNHNDVPVIMGTNPSGLNVNATYTIPTAANLSDNFTFNNWAVTPNSGYTTTSGLNSRNLTIKFTSIGTYNYTLTANFTLPDNTTYSASRTVTITPLLSTPVISANKPLNVGKNTKDITFSVNNPQVGVTYEWLYTKGGVSGNSNLIQGGSSITLEVYDPGIQILTSSSSVPVTPNSIRTPLYSIKCRARFGSSVSPWSHTLVVFFTQGRPIVK